MPPTTPAAAAGPGGRCLFVSSERILLTVVRFITAEEALAKRSPVLARFQRFSCRCRPVKKLHKNVVQKNFRHRKFSILKFYVRGSIASARRHERPDLLERLTVDQLPSEPAHSGVRIG